MAFENGVKSIRAVAYNGARTVYIISMKKVVKVIGIDRFFSLSCGFRLGGFRKRPVLLTFINVFMLT